MQHGTRVRSASSAATNKKRTYGHARAFDVPAGGSRIRMTPTPEIIGRHHFTRHMRAFSKR